MSSWTDRLRRGRQPSAELPTDRPDVPVFDLEGVVVEVAGGERILDGVDLSIPGRGITVVVGPSGAGKSTIARLLNRLEAPTSGTVRFRGADVATLDPLALRRRVGLVFQRPALFGGTVRDNLRVAGGGVGDDDARFVRALAAVALDPDVLDQDAGTLSGGEGQRVCLVRTMLAEPQVLVADEATASVDPTTRTALESRARELARSGVPIVWITHELAQLTSLGDLGVVVIGGAVRAVGPPSDLFEHSDPAVRGFLSGEETS